MTTLLFTQQLAATQVQTTPQWVSETGFEWFYRLLTAPARLLG